MKTETGCSGKMPMMIDLNSGLGESFGAWKMGMDEDVMGRISSAMEKNGIAVKPFGEILKGKGAAS
jgi:hypothetical protein